MEFFVHFCLLKTPLKNSTGNSTENATTGKNSTGNFTALSGNCTATPNTAPNKLHGTTTKLHGERRGQHCVQRSRLKSPRPIQPPTHPHADGPYDRQRTPKIQSPVALAMALAVAGRSLALAELAEALAELIVVRG